jgi:poly(3-hydroxybutyrate) depolymerase
MMKTLAAAAMFGASLLSQAPAVRAEAPLGASTFELATSVGRKVKPMAVHLYRPAKWTPNDRVLIVMHGRGRNGADYRDQWSSQSEATNLLIVVPEFDNQNFPGTAAYNYGTVVDDKGTMLPPETWSFSVIDEVYTAVHSQTGAKRERYSLYGHSAGAQFVHRFLMLAKAPAADLIISANAGSYTMPVTDVAFPFGLSGVAVTDDDLRRAFARPVIVLLGDADTDPNHQSLPRQPGAMAQGPHRLARGSLFFSVAKKRADDLGAPFNWTLVTVPGVGHSNTHMATRASELVAAGAQ